MKRDLTDTLRGLGQGLVDAAQNRLQLLQSELAEEADRLGTLLAFQVLVALLGLLTVQSLALIVLALAWDTPWRTPATLALSALAGLATFLAYQAYSARRDRSKPIFSTSVEELEKDRRALEKAL